jgi:uncharacterized RDD family membrane protein YckC
VGKQRNWVPKQETPSPDVASEPPVGDVDLVPADLSRRFGALVVDWILCLLISGLFASPHRVWWIPSVVLVVEYTFFIGLFTRTPGMFVTGVRCVSITNGGRIGIARAAIRGVLLALLIPALLMDRQRRGWHDKAAGSIVVPGRRPATS